MTTMFVHMHGPIVLLIVSSASFNYALQVVTWTVNPFCHSEKNFHYTSHKQGGLFRSPPAAPDCYPASHTYLHACVVYRAVKGRSSRSEEDIV